MGCGGSSGGPTNGSTFAKTSVPVQLTVPTGYTGPAMTDLTLWTSAAQSSPASGGTGTAVVFGGGPQYADVRDDQGRMVLSGFVGTERQSIDSESTAELLAFFYTGGANLIDDGPEIWLEGIADAAGFDDVVNAVEAQLAAQGYVDVEGSVLKTALENLASTLAGRGRGTIADPSSDSGISLNTITDGEIGITNVYLRRLVGFLQRTGYRDAENKFVEAPGPVTSFNIDPPKRFSGVIGTITDLAKNDLPYSPVNVGPYPIPFDAPAGSIATVYELRVGGLGSKKSYPNLFKGEELTAHRTVVMKSLLLDGIFPVILKVLLPLKGDALDEILQYTNGNAIFGEMLNTLLQTAPQVYDLASQGKNEEALIAVYEAFMGSGPTLTLFTQFLIQAAEHFSIEFFENSGTFAEKLSGRLALLGIVDMIGSSADLILFFRDVAVSEQASKFEILSTGGKATIFPEDWEVLLDGSTGLSVVIQDKNPDAVYRYEWTVNEGFVVSNANGTTTDAPGGVLVGSSELATVSNSIENRNPGVAVVRCKVVRVDGGVDRPVAAPTVEVSFAKISVTPNPAVLNPNEKITLTAKLEGKGPVYWQYKLSSTELGTIDRLTLSSQPQVIFSAGPNKGTATITVEAYADALGAKKLGEVAVPVRIGEVTGIPVTVLFTSTLYNDTVNYTNAWVGAVFSYVESMPTVSGAIRYRLLRNGEKMLEWTAGQDPTPYHTTYSWGKAGVGGVPITFTEYVHMAGTINGVNTRDIIAQAIANDLAALQAWYEGAIISVEPIFVDDDD